MNITVMNQHCVQVVITTHSFQWKNDLSRVIASFLHLVSVILHTCGLYLLMKIKKTRSSNMVVYTNKNLLVLLSCSELSTGLFSIIGHICLIMDSPNIAVSIPASIMWISGGFSLSVIYMITLNRLLSAVFVLWYRRMMTKRIFVVMVGSVGVIMAGISMGCNAMVYGYGITTSLTSACIISRLIITLLYSFYLIFCVLTYILIFITIINSRRSLQNNCNDANSTTTFRFIRRFLKTHGYTAPFFISLTFLIFVVVPYIAETVSRINKYSVLVFISNVWNLTCPLNNISVPVVSAINEGYRQSQSVRVRVSVF